ncbi:TetR/AcrR family transcriptional regulator [Nocardia grenadensis]|uniref:TetR/AcrR family transcriptional regulator n=1 Tax=Nocardia grenadensis TaxID=931537 RepID=UPI0007A546EB|nr:TetR/AcrR family transcriptional regulator [Nocardia grenadensis]
MSRSDQGLTRDKERTRLAVLEAAERMFAERGGRVSLSDIAAAAGVTKGGLMHHFPNRDALLAGVTEHLIAKVWAEIHECIDLSENRPGKFTRGYVRALTSGSESVARAFSPTGLVVTLGTVSGLEQLFAEDARRLDEAFDADGLAPGTTSVIRFAAEGLATAVNSPYLAADRLESARAQLLAMTETAAPGNE